MKSILYKSLGVFLLVIGVILFILPIPVGMIVMSIGAVVLIPHSRRFGDGLRRFRARYNYVDRAIRSTGQFLPERFRSTLETTQPDFSD